MNRAFVLAPLLKHGLSKLSQRYVTALRKHLKQGPQASLGSARGLGKQAMGLGLETLDLARIHEEAVGSLKPFKEGLNQRAGLFFKEALTPLEEAIDPRS